MWTHFKILFSEKEQRKLVWLISYFNLSCFHTTLGNYLHRLLLLKLGKQLVVEDCIQRGLCAEPHPLIHARNGR